MQTKIDEYKFLEDKNILIFKPSIIEKFQDSIEVLREIKEIIKKYNYPNVLADFRNLRTEFSIISSIEKVKQWKKVDIPNAIKIGVLFNQMEDAFQFRLNMLFSSGYTISTFTNYDKAIKWLSE